MKRQSPGRIVFFVFLAFINHQMGWAQDTLFIKNQEVRIVKVVEIGPKELTYRILGNEEGPLIRIEKEGIEKIKFATGLVEYFSQAVPKDEKQQPVGNSSDPLERMTHLGKPVNMATYFDGARDAKLYYRGYKGAGTGSLCAGILTVYGLPVPVVTSLISPKNTHLYVPDQDLYLRNEAYASGFEKQAHRIKAGKAWSNYGIGFGSTVGLGLILLIAALGNMY